MDGIIKISVRNLVEFALKSGSIDSGFGSRSAANEGTKGHRAVQKLREKETPGYAAEVSIVYLINNEDISIEINGRIDGVFEENGSCTIEEIKTTERNLNVLEEYDNPMHWAQAKCYAYIYGMQNKYEKVAIQLTYYHRSTKEIKSFLERFNILELEAFFSQLVNKYLKWAGILKDWKHQRDSSIKETNFPFKTYRKGQREFAVAVYRTICGGKKLFAKAPTGIGKTIAAIFPSIKGVLEGKAEKIFYLTAKTSTRNIAEEAFENLRKHGLKFKTVTITAKEKVCPRDKVSCKPEDCELAEGYYDRIDNAIEDLFKIDNLNKAAIIDYSQKHRVCPFEFSLDAALFCDGIICDYNYVFDPRVYLKRFFMEIREDYSLLIDEAHNLVDRAREMFSSELIKSDFLGVKNDVGSESPEIKKSLNEINSLFIKLRKKLEEDNQTHSISKEPPTEIIGSLEKFIEKSELLLSKGGNYIFREKLTELYFNALNFVKTLEVYDERYVTYVEKSGQDIRVKLFCLDPSKLLRESMKRGKSSVIFSATLSPMDYFMDILGSDDGDYRITIKSPFDKEKLCLMVANNIKTQYSVRELSYKCVAEYIYAAVSIKMGNYIVFFPSYKYLNEVYKVFKELYPDIRTICQEGNMTEEEREKFLDCFSKDNMEDLIGFAVMGGAFSEGIDLTGDRLIGAIIVGVGLPQICLERDIIREHFSSTNAQGFEYAYVYPGMNKVLQAAGRVIRTEEDKGIVFLIDERFSRSGYRKLMPSEWTDINWIKNKKDIENTVKDFWDRA